MFTFTRQERQVIIFLLTLALFGIGADFIAKKSSTTKSVSFVNPDIAKLDLNRADQEALLGVPGIGEKLAARIIEYRNGHGAFREIEELKKIKGITDYRFCKIKDFFCLANEKRKK